MDQPTNLNITVKGNAEDVKKAALAAQERIDCNTRGFQKSLYVYDDSIDFEEKMDDLIRGMGNATYSELEDGTFEYTSEQDSYGCIWQEDITGIAKAIIEVAPAVEAHISAVITITYSEGYDLCVDIDCIDGEISVYVSEEPYEDWEEDEDDEDDEDDEEDE